MPLWCNLIKDRHVVPLSGTPRDDGGENFANREFYATLKLLIGEFNMFSQVGIGLLIARIVTFIFVAIVVLDLIGIIPAIIIDVKRKKFHWSKWVIISFICAFILFFIINLVAGILFLNPADDTGMFPALNSTAPTGN
ncbi:MAG: hypothetical protein Q7K55_01305 [Candidatus Levybacteria bacterium]|nr:hypothetical protein [Candidatus Levybacteria bacterium]